jgi:HNH endonuclease
MATNTLDRLMFVQGGLCFFCKQPLPKSEASIEHLFAKANGGGNSDENCVACCKSINRLLGSMPLKHKFQVVLNQNGQFKCPNGIMAEESMPAIGTQPKTPTGTKAKTDIFDMVVANLTQRANARPRTLKTLTSTVASLLPKNRTEAEVTALVERLQSTGKVSVLEKKISYDL